MTTKTDAPSVFISYSWIPTTNKERIIEIAKRLQGDGVNVIIDVWSLAEGQDKYEFMEKMVNDSRIKRVLLFCNKEYVEKANKRKGGVGVESLIISDEIYKKVEQKKFVPIIMEKDEYGKKYLPTFVKSRIYIDFSAEDIVEDQYEQLLRNIFNKPKYKKPPIGKPPPYIYEEESEVLKTAHKVKTIKNALINGKLNSQIFIDDYFETFLNAIKDFEITDSDLIKIEHIDEEILKRIQSLLPYRDDFINFLNVILKYSIEIDIEKLHHFLEKCAQYYYSLIEGGFSSRNLGSLKVDSFRFFFYEIFLYLSALFVYYEKFEELGYLLHNTYFFIDFSYSDFDPHNFTGFNVYIYSLNGYRNKRLQLNRVNITADLIQQRASNSIIVFDKLKEIDVLLFYISLMKNEPDKKLFRWFPNLSCYTVDRIPLLEKTISLRYFNKIKPLFDIQNASELIEKVTNVIELDKNRVQNFHYNYPFMDDAFGLKKIATLK